jgi:hypothetical protein
MSESEILHTNSTEATDAIPAKVLWPVAVWFRKRAVVSRWADFEWEPASVELAQAEPALTLSELIRNGETQWRWHGVAMDLHPSEGEGYWLNLTSESPCVFVMWRKDDDAPHDDVPKPVVVTASYNEAGRMLDAGDRVDRVAMPEAMQAALAEYTMKFYKPEKRRKVKRNDPFADRLAAAPNDAPPLALNDIIVPDASPAAKGFARGG